MVAISSGEARSANLIPRATRIMFAMLAFVYLGATAVLVGIFPWDRVGITQSPFVTVFVVAGIPAASALMNFVVLNRRTLGRECQYLCRQPDVIFARPRRPRSCVTRETQRLRRSSPGAADLNRWRSPRSRHGKIRAAIRFPLHRRRIRLRRNVGLVDCPRRSHCLSPQNFREKLAALPMRAPGGAVLSAIGFIGIALAIASTWWVPQSRITIVSGLPYLAILSIGYLLVRKRRGGGTISE